MRILLTGATGQLGEALQAPLARQGELLAWGRDRLDLSELETLADRVRAANPDAIVNAAAYTAVDRAESEPELAERINGKAPGELAAVAAELGAAFLHVSTDYVFDGSQSLPYRETDPTAPLGVYGRSKQQGEAAVLACGGDRAAIVRTAWVYGAGRTGNFVKTMLRLGAEREALRVVADQVGSPTWTGDLAGAIADLLPRLTPETAGIYHFTNSGVASWYDFAVAIFEEARPLGFPLAVRQVAPITTADYPTPARRPAYSVLSGVKLAQLRGQTAPHWREGLRHMLRDWKAKVEAESGT